MRKEPKPKWNQERESSKFIDSKVKELIEALESAHIIKDKLQDMEIVATRWRIKINRIY